VLRIGVGQIPGGVSGLCKDGRDLDQLSGVVASLFNDVEDRLQHAGHILSCQNSLVTGLHSQIRMPVR
jgi:hypothetical protein